MTRKTFTDLFLEDPFNIPEYVTGRRRKKLEKLRKELWNEQDSIRYYMKEEL